jgi:hypothetical protein
VRPLLLIGLLGGVVGLTGCGSGDGRTNAKYCAAVQHHLADLNDPHITAPGDIAKYVAVYQSVSKAAPLAVEKEWDILTIAYQTAATVVAGDPASVQRTTEAANGSQQSAIAVADYTLRLCNVQIGTPTVPVTAPVPSTGVPGAPTSSAG